MITIQPVKASIYNKSQGRRKPFITSKSDFVTFSGLFNIGKIPSELAKLDISRLDKNDKNVLFINSTGYLAEIIKYFAPKTNKTYAIKRVFSPDMTKHQTANPVLQTNIEANIYKRLKGIKNIPTFYCYRGNSGENSARLLDNYLIMSWVNGVQASEKGVFYNFELITHDNLKKIYQTITEFDKAGVIHNDLWSGNILFEKNKISIVDFNRSHTFDPQRKIEENNLDSLKVRFINKLLSDIYQRKGEKACLEMYRTCLKFEIEYYKNKQIFYLQNGNKEGFHYYRKLAKKLHDRLKNSEVTKETMIKTIFNSDVNCAEIFAKYFEFQDDETSFHLQKALNILEIHPKIIGKEKAKLIKSNIFITNELSRLIKIQGARKDFEKLLKLLNNSEIYTQKERGKPYYALFKRFCEFNVKYKKLSDCPEQKALLKQEYGDIIKIKKLKDYFDDLDK